VDEQENLAAFRQKTLEVVKAGVIREECRKLERKVKNMIRRAKRKMKNLVDGGGSKKSFYAYIK
jgi:hypothetical protein